MLQFFVEDDSAALVFRQPTGTPAPTGSFGRRNSFRALTDDASAVSVFGRAQFITAATGGQTLTQSSRFDNANTFYTHTLTPGVVALSQSARFDNSNTFYTHVLDNGAIQLVQSSRFDNSATFYTHVLSAGAVALEQSARFDNSQTFYTHVLTQPSTQELTQSARFDNSATFYTHVINGVPFTAEQLAYLEAYMWDVEIENGLTARQFMRIMAAVLAGKVSGANTSTETFIGLDGTTERVVSASDSVGNRIAVTLNGD